MRIRQYLKFWLFIVSLSILALIWITPMVWMLITSFKLEGRTITFPIQWIPQPFSLQSYRALFERAPIIRWFFNSMVTSSLTTLGVLIIDAPAAYALSRLRFAGRNFLFIFTLAGFMVPNQVILIPLYLMFDKLGLVNTYPGLILPRLAIPLGVFILRQFFMGIPAELEEAAVLDGCSRFRVFYNIILPLSGPALAAVAIFTFIGTWNEFLWPLIITSQEKMFTLPIGLAAFQGSYNVKYAMLMAASIIGSAPILIAFIIFQRRIIQGITMSGLKG